MRFYKVLVHLIVLVCVIITVYVFQTDNSSITTNIFREHSKEIRSSKQNDTSSKTFSATLNNINVKPSKNNTSVNSLLKHNVWCIFTKVKHRNVPLRYKFERFINSLLKYSSIVITLNVISDNYSQIIAESVIKKSMLDSGKIIKSVYHDVINITESISNLTSIMQPAFSPQRGGYYSDALFYISLGLYELTDPEQINAIMLDVDVEFRTDIALLFKQFDSFSDTELLGLAPELSPVYQHVLYLYRSRHNGTKFGSPLTSGGFPGLNSGVILFRFDKIRTSSLYKLLMTKDAVSSLMAKYSFMGHLGDQDMYTLMKVEHPELIHILPCGWNRQLCKWWRDHGYPDVFDSFAHCNEPVKLYHGNCNSPIPRQISVSNRL